VYLLKLLQMKKLHYLALIALILIGLSGCEKGSDTNVATADAFVKSIKNAQGATVFAVIHSVFSYNGMTSVKVTGPDGTVKQLTNYENGGISFYNEPVDADYSATIPTAGTYTYLVTFKNGEEITYTNALSSNAILPAIITSLAKTTKGDSVYISWNAIANTHAYQIKVTQGTTVIYSSSPFVDNSSPKQSNLKVGFSLNSLTSNVAGTYTFSLGGLLYETTAYDYLQAISTTTQNIVL
jgi:hypothetical protein